MNDGERPLPGLSRIVLSGGCSYIVNAIFDECVFLFILIVGAGDKVVKLHTCIFRGIGRKEGVVI